MRSPIVLGVLALVVAGCGGPYAYVPTEEATATVVGEPAARYAVPPESPRGDVKVSSTGVEKIELASGDKVRTLHVRLTVSNDNGAAPWVIDARNVLIDLAGTGRERPAFVRGTPTGSTVLEIAPGDLKNVDLYYPLAEGQNKEGEIPHFDVLWQVQTPERVVAERTPFARVEIAPPVYGELGYGVGFGYGPFGWYDPFFGPPVSVGIGFGYYGYPR